VGRAILDKVYNKIEEAGTMESQPRLEGRNMAMLIVPR
jgi:translation initiation factor IF-3